MAREETQPVIPDGLSLKDAWEISWEARDRGYAAKVRWLIPGVTHSVIVWHHDWDAPKIFLTRAEWAALHPG